MNTQPGFSRDLTPEDLLRAAGDSSPTEESTLDPLEAAVATLSLAVEAQAADKGACFTPEAVAGWQALYIEGPAEYERLREQARQAGARVKAIDKCATLNARARSGNVRIKHPTNGSDASESRAGRFREGPWKAPKPEPSMPGGALLYESERFGKQRLIDSQAAEIVACALRGALAWDGESATWLLWIGTHWEPLTTTTAALRMFAETLRAGTNPLGFRPTYMNGVVSLVQHLGLLSLPAEAPAAVPFENGLLDLKTEKLAPATPQHALTWCLPHRYDPREDCPTIQAWLLSVVDGDAETVEFLRAWLAALVRGIPLQIFLMLLGRGGTGKGAFQRLAMALIGERNAAVCTLRDLEENRFELAKVYGKRLCLINEAGRHGGALNVLKAMTGGDHLSIERKHVQQTGTFVFGGLVLMATNEDLQTTDATSGAGTPPPNRAVPAHRNACRALRLGVPRRGGRGTARRDPGTDQLAAEADAGRDPRAG